MYTFPRTQEVTAVTGVHLVRLSPASPNDPPGPRALRPTPDWELWRGEWATWLACLPPPVPARMDAAQAARESGALPAQQAQEPRAEAARGAEGAQGDLNWDQHAVRSPLGGEVLPLVMEVYGLLSWATSGTTRNRPLDAVLLRRDGGNLEVPPAGWVALEDHERVLRVLVQAGWPDREPTWPAFLEGGAVLRVMDPESNNWLPRALRTALTHWRYRQRNPPPPQPEPPSKRRRR